MEEWKNGRVENCERMEKWEVRKDLVFPHLCLVEMVEKQKDGKLFCLVEIKNEIMKNKVDINLPLYLYYIY